MKPPAERIFITAHDVADMLEFQSAAQFLTRRAALERDQGFPTPVVFCQRPLKWRRTDVQSWLDGAYLPPDIDAARPVSGDRARRVVMLHQARQS